MIKRVQMLIILVILTLDVDVWIHSKGSKLTLRHHDRHLFLKLGRIILCESPRLLSGLPLFLHRLVGELEHILLLDQLLFVDFLLYFQLVVSRRDSPLLQRREETEGHVLMVLLQLDPRSCGRARLLSRLPAHFGVAACFAVLILSFEAAPLRALKALEVVADLLSVRWLSLAPHHPREAPLESGHRRAALYAHYPCILVVLEHSQLFHLLRRP